MEKFMQAALDNAIMYEGEKEVPVGCVIVLDGVIIGNGNNKTNYEKNATRHAEFLALEQVKASHGLSILSRCELYVTIEPCIMCASALSLVGIKKVYFGAYNDRFGGTGSVLSLHNSTLLSLPFKGFENEAGIMEKEAIQLLKDFYDHGNPKAPPAKRQRNLFPSS